MKDTGSKNYTNGARHRTANLAAAALHGAATAHLMP